MDYYNHSIQETKKQLNTLSLMGSEITLDRKGQKWLPNWDSNGSWFRHLLSGQRLSKQFLVRIWSEGSSYRRKAGRTGLGYQLNGKILQPGP